MQQQVPNNSGVVKDEISLKELILSVQEWWKYMKSKWKIILLAGVVGGILGLVYSLVVPAKYKAEASFVLENAEGAGSGVMSIAAKFGFGGGGSSDGLFGDEDNMVVFLKSRTIGAQTLLTTVNFNGTKELLIDRYLKFNKFRDKWKSSERLKNIRFKEYPQQNTLLGDSIITSVHKSILKKNIDISKPDKEGNIINVITTSTDELFSKAYTDYLIKNATEFYADITTQKSQNNVDILQGQVDSVKKLLNMAIRGAATNADAVPNMNVAYQRLKVPSQKSTVDIEMNKAILEELVKNLELAKIDLRRETPLIQIIDSPILPLEMKKVGKTKGILLGLVVLMGVTIMTLTVSRFIYRIYHNL